jgi:lipopolysaccharide/colanic/teichoic acid biosynthesis glycosyltransferase
MIYPSHVSAWCMSKQKRCFDLAASITALILLSPLMFLIGCLIKFTSKGPALYRQERVGFGQRPFVILKFRTMKHRTAEKDDAFTVTKQGDPRITSLGILLRRFKLDELPQLVNVLCGEMSLVGPRPKIASHENLCMLCRPGMTGAASVRFCDEENLLAEVPSGFIESYVVSELNPEKCRIDSHYIETAGFSTDLTILADTVFRLGRRSKTRHDASPIDPLELSPIFDLSLGEQKPELP